MDHFQELPYPVSGSISRQWAANEILKVNQAALVGDSWSISAFDLGRALNCVCANQTEFNSMSGFLTQFIRGWEHAEHNNTSRLYLPAILSESLGISRSEAHRVINAGKVKVNGEICRKLYANSEIKSLAVGRAEVSI